MAGEVAAKLCHVSQESDTSDRKAHFEVLGKTGQPGHAAFDPELDRRPARRSIVADCMAGWRSGGFGRTRRRRGNSLTKPTPACGLGCGHEIRPTMPCEEDLIRRGVAP